MSSSGSSLGSNRAIPIISGAPSIHAQPASSSSSKALVINNFTLGNASEQKILEDLLRHQNILTQLAMYSNYEYTRWEKIKNDNEKLAQLLSACTEFQDPAHEDTIDQLKNTQITNAPARIVHYGLQSTINGQTSDIRSKPPALVTNPVEVGHPRETILALSNNRTLSLHEKKEQLGADTLFTLEIKDIDDALDQRPDDLMSAARASIHDFLAAADPDNTTPSFNDGFSLVLLTVFMSYCKYINVHCQLGTMQKIRLFASELMNDPALKSLVTDDDWAKIQKNEVVALSSSAQNGLMAKITEWEKAGRRLPEQSTIDKYDWEAWLNNIPVDERDGRYPPLNKSEVREAERIRNKVIGERSPSSASSLIKNSAITTNPNTGNNAQPLASLGVDDSGSKKNQP